MAADLHIHVIPKEPVSGTMSYWDQRTGGYKNEEITDYVDRDTISMFFTNFEGSLLSTFWKSESFEHARERASALIENTPSVWVGEVSWLKAALLEDTATFIPEPVAQVSQIIGNTLPVITDELIDDIRKALATPNATFYKTADKDVVAFLEQHKGLQCFTVSW
jgi:hypothetical protein